MPQRDGKMIYGVVMEPELAHEARVVAAKMGTSRSALMRTLLVNFLAAQHCVNADSGDSHPAENLSTPGVSHAQEGGW